MRKSVEKKITALTEGRRRLSIRHRILLLLVCAVAAATTYTLVMPAITMEGDYVCGKEVHVHSDDCYVNREDGGRELVCGKEAHAHDESCLVRSADDGKYTCGYDYEHLHGDECYVNGKMICTLREHVHTSSCLPQQTSQVRRAAAEANLTEMVETEQSGEMSALTAEDQSQDMEDVQQSEAPDDEDPTQASLDEDIAQEEPGDQPAEGVDSTGDSSQEDGDQPTEEPTDEPTEAPTEELTEEPTDELAEELSEQPSEEPTEMLTDFMEETITDEALSGMAMEERANYNNENGKDEIVPLETLDDTTITFHMKKGNKDVIPELTLNSETYSFFLNITSPNLYMYDPDNEDQEIYTCRVSYPGIQLLLGDSADGIKPAEEYASRYVRVTETGSAWMKVVKEGDGVYLFLFKSIGSQTRSITVEGTARGCKGASDRTLDKSAAFDAENMTYRYTIRASLPRAVDNYDQYYRLDDWTTVDNKNRFNGFLENQDSLRVFYTEAGGGEQEMLPIQTASGDASAKMAYYLDSNGVMYFYSRTVHSGDHLVSAPVDYDGWGVCWQAEDAVQIRITYLDTASKSYYTPTSKIYNLSRLWNQDENVENHEGIFADNTVSYDGLLDKNYSKTPTTNLLEFTILYNSKGLDMGDVATILWDEMDNGILQTDTVQVTRMSDGQVLTRDSGYTLDVKTGQRGFKITIYNPGSSTYQITYQVQPADPAQNTTSNRVWMGNSGASNMSVNKNAVFNENNINYDDRAFSIELTFTKTYEGNNPETGGTFAIYQASDDRQVALSATRGGSSTHDERVCYQVRTNGRQIERSSSIYQSEGTSDIIEFTSGVQLRYGVVYYLKETEAPFGYATMGQDIYFYACSPDPAKANDDPAGLDKVPSGTTLIRLDDWNAAINGEGVEEDQICHDMSNEVTLYNGIQVYDLPDTGGSGLESVLSAAGVGMMAVVLAVLLRKRVL